MQKLAEAEQERQERQHSQIQTWIASPDVEYEHLEICQDRQKYPKSGQWILDQEKIQNWLSPDASTNSMLWISGNPGTGTMKPNLNLRYADSGPR